jgi:preprotein translocase subunit SecF|tara:strand:- start:124 stop:1023 length:900 start_codon:yes stop_codon:yes gene_type:complete
MDFIGKRTYFLTVSMVLSVIAVVILFVPGLNLGIDFASGTSITYKFEGGDPDLSSIRSALEKSGHGNAVIQKTGTDEYFVRTTDLGDTGKDVIDEKLREIQDVKLITLATTSVGKSVADDTVKNAVIAVSVAVLFVMLYIMYAFRSVPESYKYAVAAILALVHDIVIVLGIFTILGIVVGSEVNSIFIVGILTTIGYSVNDTIVIFDRVRENVSLAPNRAFRANVNISINESITRSLGTSVTTLTVILAILLFGGVSLRDFLYVLLSGVIVGTYSSIFIAAQILVAWDSRGILFWRRKI